MIRYNKKLKSFSRALRKNMTDAELLIWSKIRRKQIKGLQFYRQKVIENYILDFYCPASKLVIEIDGGQHFSEEAIHKDNERDRFLLRHGFKVLRFSNTEVLTNIDGVVQAIYEHC
ncbi:endonuclease domain-containing protein [Geovibrio ferrireducens]|uniref:endonuclease domain-containing protein n=1 Tax=Geovibrio ferrireducens TaxID=46201 RepID=UPI0022479B5B|nr:DUF559 domain-containing protein [Geovibrio ferrireducens]